MNFINEQEEIRARIANLKAYITNTENEFLRLQNEIKEFANKIIKKQSYSYSAPKTKDIWGNEEQISFMEFYTESPYGSRSGTHRFFCGRCNSSFVTVQIGLKSIKTTCVFCGTPITFEV